MEKFIKNSWKKSSKIIEKIHQILLKKNHQKFLKKLLKKIIKNFWKKSSKIFAKSPKNSSKNNSRPGKKIFFSNQTKNKYKLIFNQNKKKIFFLGLGEKKFIKKRKSQDWSRWQECPMVKIFWNRTTRCYNNIL